MRKTGSASASRRERTFAILLAFLGLLGVTSPAQELALLEPPPNDERANAETITGIDFEIIADLGGAVWGPGFGIGGTIYHGLNAWWNWTAPADGIWSWEVATNLTPALVYLLETGPAEKTVAKTYLQIVPCGMIPELRGSFPARVGTKYEICAMATSLLVQDDFLPWIDEESRTSMPIRIAFKKATSATSSNDSFDQRRALTNQPMRFIVDQRTATGEPHEPKAAWDALQRSLWWTWQAPGYGTATIRVVDTNQAAPVVTIFQGQALPQLQRNASSATIQGGGFQMGVARLGLDWDTGPEQPYEIQVDSFPSRRSLEPIELEISFVPAPPNDTPEGALILDGMQARTRASTAGAVARPGEPVFTGDAASASNTVWFRWIAPTNGIVEISNIDPVDYTQPTSTPAWTVGFVGGWVSGCTSVIEEDAHPLLPFEPAFALFSSTNGPAGELRPATRKTYVEERILAEVFAGETYFIALDCPLGSSGETPVNLLLTPVPPNASYENRIMLSREALRIAGRTIGAPENPELTYQDGANRLGRSVWWEWSPPTAGRWVLFLNKGLNMNRLVLYSRQNETRAELGSTIGGPIVFWADPAQHFIIGAFARQSYGGSLEFTLTPVVAPDLRVESYRVPLPSFSRFTFRLPDNAGLPFDIQSSANLTDWMTIYTTEYPWAKSYIVDGDPAAPMNFFRTRLLEEPSTPANALPASP